MIRPLFDSTDGTPFVVAASSVAALGGAGGARAVATSGLESVGGGGPLWPFGADTGVFDELGNFTVAVGLSEPLACCGGGWLAITSAGVAGFEGGRWPGGPGGKFGGG